MGNAEGSIEMVQMGRNQGNGAMGRRAAKTVDIKKRLIAILEGNTVTLVMTIVTLFALIGDDIRLWSF